MLRLALLLTCLTALPAAETVVVTLLTVADPLGAPIPVFREPDPLNRNPENLVIQLDQQSLVQYVDETEWQGVPGHLVRVLVPVDQRWRVGWILADHIQRREPVPLTR